MNGVRNPDWQGVVYGENGSGPYLLISDSAAKSIYRVSAPNPARPGPVRIEKTYRYDFPNSGNKSGGRRGNVEVAFRCAAVNGPLHFVRKEKSPARVYRFSRLADDHVNVRKGLARSMTRISRLRSSLSTTPA